MDVGMLSQLRTLSYDELLLMIKLLPNYSETLTLLLDVFQSEESLIRFLDLFAGRTIKLPPRTKLYHTINSIHVYNYYKSHSKSAKTEKELHDALLETAHRFDITTQRVTTILDRIRAV